MTFVFASETHDKRVRSACMIGVCCVTRKLADTFRAWREQALPRKRETMKRDAMYLPTDVPLD